MTINLKNIPISKRIQMVEDIWDSIAAEQGDLKITADQKTELDQRLDSYELDGIKGREASKVVSDVKNRL